MSRLSAVLTTDDLPYAELCAARLDGELFAIDDCFSPIDQPDDPLMRAEAIAIQWRDRLIAEQRTAAWVYGVLHLPPRRHELCADIGARARPSNSRHARIREVVIEPDEIRRVGPLDVTTPLRTVLDLARFAPEFGDDERFLVRGLLALDGLTLADCIAAVTVRRNLPNKKLAVQRLRTV